MFYNRFRGYKNTFCFRSTLCLMYYTLKIIIFDIVYYAQLIMRVVIYHRPLSTQNTEIIFFSSLKSEMRKNNKIEQYVFLQPRHSSRVKKKMHSTRKSNARDYARSM